MIRVTTTSNVRASLTPAELAFLDKIREESVDGRLQLFADTRRGPFYGNLTLIRDGVNGRTYRTVGASVAQVVENLLVELGRAR